jgi:hypothetical protein
MDADEEACIDPVAPDHHVLMVRIDLDLRIDLRFAAGPERLQR